MRHFCREDPRTWPPPPPIRTDKTGASLQDCRCGSTLALVPLGGFAIAADRNVAALGGHLCSARLSRQESNPFLAELDLVVNREGTTDERGAK